MVSAKRILLYRLGAIGDVIHSLAFVRLLRQKQPEARIEYIVGSNQLKELLENYCSYIDQVHVTSKKTLARDLTEIARSGVDEFIFLHSGWWKSYWLNLRYIKARRVVTYTRDDELSAVANYVTSYFPNMKSKLLLNPLAELEWHNLDNRSREIAKSYICVVPGVGNLRPHRAYPLEKWIEFIKTKLEKTDYEVKILGGPDEMKLSKLIEQRIINLDQTRIQNLIGKTSLVELAELISGADHLYSADTGILHIAAAIGCKTTSIFSITSPARFGPFSPVAKIIETKDCLCDPSTTNRPKHCSNLQDGYARCLINAGW